MNSIKVISREWQFALFGTAIGAGILFLPLQAGQGGVIATLLAMIIGFPITYYSNKFLLLICLHAEENETLNKTFRSYIKPSYTVGIMILYFVMLVAVLLAYSIALNTDFSEIFTQYHLVNFDLSKTKWFSFIILSCLSLIIMVGELFLLKFLEKITTLLAGMLILVSVMLIPFWRLSNVSLFNGNLLTEFLMVFPLMTLAVTFYPAVSPMVSSLKRNTTLEKEALNVQSGKIVLRAAMILSLFVAFFLMSTLLALPTDAFEMALSKNISILSAIGTTSKNPVFAQILVIIGFLITMIALVSSYYGVLLGLLEILEEKFKFLHINALFTPRNNLVLIVNFILWLCVITNLSVVNILGIVVAPIVGITVFCLPIVIVYKTEKLKAYRGIRAIAVFLFGLFLVLSFVIGLLLKHS